MGYTPPGHRPRRETVTVTVGYADVMAQAVRNERFRVLREARLAIERVRFFEGDYEWDKKPRRDADALRREVLATLDRLDKE